VNKADVDRMIAEAVAAAMATAKAEAEAALAEAKAETAKAIAEAETAKAETAKLIAEAEAKAAAKADTAKVDTAKAEELTRLASLNVDKWTVKANVTSIKYNPRGNTVHVGITMTPDYDAAILEFIRQYMTVENADMARTYPAPNDDTAKAEANKWAVSRVRILTDAEQAEADKAKADRAKAEADGTKVKAARGTASAILIEYTDHTVGSFASWSAYANANKVEFGTSSPSKAVLNHLAERTDVLTVVVDKLGDNPKTCAGYPKLAKADKLIVITEAKAEAEAARADKAEAEAKADTAETAKAEAALIKAIAKAERAYTIAKAKAEADAAKADAAKAEADKADAAKAEAETKQAEASAAKAAAEAEALHRAANPNEQ